MSSSKISSDEVPYLTAALEADPGNWSIRRSLAEYYLSEGDRSHAVGLVTTAPKAPDTEANAIFSAQVAALHSIRRAHHLLDAYLLHHASSARAHYLKAKLFQHQGLPEKATTHEKVAYVVKPELAQDGDAFLELDPNTYPPTTKGTGMIGVSSESRRSAQESPTDVAPPPAETEESEETPEASEEVRPLTEPDEEEAQPVLEVVEDDEDGEEVAEAIRRDTSAVSLMSGGTGMVHASVKDVMEHPDDVLNYLDEADEAEGDEDDMVSQMVERQTMLAASMTGSGEEVARKPHVERAKDSGVKFGAVTVAIVVHIVLAIVLSVAVMVIPTQPPPEIYAAVTSADVDSELQKSEVVKPTMQKNAPAAQQVEVLSSAMISDVAMPTVDTSQVNPLAGMGDQGMELGMSFSMPGGGSGMSNIPPSMAGRCSMGQRMARLKESGASTKCESAVRKALRFLRDNQNEDGSFGREFPVAMTGLTVLAFLGHCETPDSVEFGDSVTKATLYLLERADESEHRYEAIYSPGGKAAYENAIATYALAEMYTMTKASGAAARIPKLESAMKQGVKAIIDGQGSDGGWVYGYGGGGNGDMSVSGWQFQALKAATNTGERISGLERCMEKAIEYMKASQTPDGGFSYRRDQNKTKPTLVGVGALAYEMYGIGDSPEGKKAHEWLEKHRMGKGNLSLYDWYYTMQAFFLRGGENWPKWNDHAMDKILAAQSDDGSFSKAPGSHGPKDPVTQNIYKTCLCTLMLEVYYRYLPTTQKNLG